MKYTIALYCEETGEAHSRKFLEAEVYEIEDHKVALDVFNTLTRYLREAVKKL